MNKLNGLTMTEVMILNDILSKVIETNKGVESLTVNSLHMAGCATHAQMATEMRVEKAKKAFDAELSGFSFVCKYLHSNGTNRHSLTVLQQEEVRRLGDGFGPGITDSELVWDWSHVRDSSPAAVKAMEAKIRELAGK